MCLRHQRMIGCFLSNLTSLHDLWSSSVFVVLLNIMGTDTSSPYHCPGKSEWRHWIGRKAGTTHVTWVSVHISFCHIEWFRLKWTWQKWSRGEQILTFQNTAINWVYFGGLTLDYGGLTLMVLCLARQLSHFKTYVLKVSKTLFLLHIIAGWWNLPLHLLWKHVWKRMPYWYLNLILSMDYDVSRVNTVTAAYLEHVILHYPS